MSLRVLVPLLLLLAAVGGLSLYLLDSGGERGERGAVTGPGGAVVASSGEHEVVELAPSTNVAQQATADPSPASEQRTVVAATPSVDEVANNETSEPGMATVSGRVVDVRGKPIEGARVSAGTSVIQVLVLESRGSDSSSRGGARTAVTDADGRFELTGVSPGQPTFRASADEYAPLTTKNARIAAMESFEFPEAFVLEDSAILSGVVLDSTGAPVSGARVKTRPKGGAEFGFNFSFGRGGFETAEDGTFRLTQLERDELEIAVTHEDYARYTGTVDAQVARILPSMEIRLPRGFTVAGRVTGVPVSEASDLVIVAEPQVLNFSSGFTLRNADVDADGRFELRGLLEDSKWEISAMKKPEGEATSGIYYPQRGSRVTSKQPVKAGQYDVELPWDGGVTLTFTVIDEKTREPIEALEIRHGFGWLNNFPLAVTDSSETEYPGGVVRLAKLLPDGKKSEFHLQIDALGYQEWKRDDIDFGEAGDLDLGTIELTPVASVQVTVLDKRTGAPIEGALVRLKPAPKPRVPGVETNGTMSFSVQIGGSTEEVDGDPFSVMMGGETNAHTATTNSDGLAVLDSFEGQTCLVSVTADEYAPGHVSDWELPEGEVVSTTIELGLGGRVAVQAIDANGQVLSARKIEHKAPNAASGGPRNLFGLESKDRVTDTDGRVLFTSLEPGTHRFRLAKASNSAGGGRMMVFDIPGLSLGGDDDGDDWTNVEVFADEEAELTLQEQPTGSLRGRVTEAGEPLRRARLSLKKVETGGASQGRSVQVAIPGAMFRSGGGGASAKTDRKGNYTFEGLEPGSYTLTITHKDRAMPYERELPVLVGVQTQDVDLPLAIIAGRVTDQDGNGVKGLRVSVSVQQPEGDDGPQVRTAVMFAGSGGGGFMGMGGDTSLLTNGDGSYELRGVRADVDLVVTVNGFELNYQEVNSDVVQVGGDERLDDIDLTVERGGSVEVLAIKADGSNAGFVHVTLTPIDFEAETRDEFLMNGTGQVKGLKPGGWTVSAGNLPGMPGVQSTSEPTELVIEVKAGESVLAELTLPE